MLLIAQAVRTNEKMVHGVAGEETLQGIVVHENGTQGKRHTRRNVTVEGRTITLLVSGEQGQLYIDDLDLRKEGSTVTLALKQRLLQTCLFLQDAFSLVLVEPLCWEMPHSGQTRQDDLSRQLWLFLLNAHFAVVQQLPLLAETLALCDDCLYLHLQFDPFAPEKLPSSFWGISWLLSVRSRLSMLVVLLMLMLRSLLVTHEGYLPSFLETTCSDNWAAEKKVESAPHGLVQIRMPPFCNAVVCTQNTRWTIVT